ncbi:transposase [Streptomyces sp. NPDC003328]
MGSKYTKRYTEEFKRDAIALVDSSGKTVTAVARELGTSSKSLRGWYRRARADRGEGELMVRGEVSVADRHLSFSGVEPVTWWLALTGGAHLLLTRGTKGHVVLVPTAIAGVQFALVRGVMQVLLEPHVPVSRRP